MLFSHLVKYLYNSNARKAVTSWSCVGSTGRVGGVIKKYILIDGG